MSLALSSQSLSFNKHKYWTKITTFRDIWVKILTEVELGFQNVNKKQRVTTRNISLQLLCK